MGNSPSRPTEHVFYGETPISFSPTLLSTLQSSPESDSTRQKEHDLHIQKLVQAELERLKKREDEVLSQLELEKSTTAATTTTTTIGSSSSLGIIAAIPPTSGSDRAGGLVLSSQQLKEKVERLKSKLGMRKEGEEGEAEGEIEIVRKARSDVVTCLRVYDRKPLECWREVRAFREVGRARGKEFVEAVLGEK